MLRSPLGERRLRARVLTVRLASFAVAVAAIAALAVTGPMAAAPVAAASPTGVTVAWVNDSSAASVFQPARSTTSPHYTEFDELAVTVSQTSGLSDQAIRVGVTGFAGTKTSTEFGQNSQNYLQAMQCWGDPADAAFRETCQWGGRYAQNNGLGNSVYPDNAMRVAPRDANPYSPTTVDVQFRTAQGTVVSGKPELAPATATRPAEERYPILNFFSPATTNEVTSARVGADGTGSFDFEIQTANQAPQLACGKPGQLRCWLVIVPRGTVFGGDGAACSGIVDSATAKPFAAGRVNTPQGGSPINPNCDYWDNRIVVPLDFTPLGNNCAVGSAEQRIVGSELMAGAMSSWQPALCDSLKTTFSFSTNPDSIARLQLLEGQATVAFAGYPLSPGELETNEERQQLADTALSYAPVAISGVVVSYMAEFSNGRTSKLTLSPRLMAKLLTQSYTFTVPWNSADPAKNFAHLPDVNRGYYYFTQDPEFLALNPTGYTAQNPSIVLPGPSGADAIKQVWRWILADRKAISFLNGQADESGMRVNPYYLPVGHADAKVPTFTESGDFAMANGERVMRPVGLANLDGTPMSLSTATLDTFMKADESRVPIKLTNERSRFDSIQFAPYVDNLLGAARIAFRADAGSKTQWDITKLNAAGEIGDWVSSGAQPPGQKFMIAITDSPSAARYGLDTAELVLANSAEVAVANTDGFAAALGALRATTLDTVRQVDPALVTAGYPLTMVTYLATNLTESPKDLRARTADMLTQVTGTGQVPGTAAGQLPPGYLPLTADMVTIAQRSAIDIRNYVAKTAVPMNGIAQDAYEPSSSTTDDLEAGAGEDPSLTSDADSEASTRTEAVVNDPLARVGLGISLAFGLAGSVFAPILFRGRTGFF